MFTSSALIYTWGIVDEPLALFKKTLYESTHGCFLASFAQFLSIITILILPHLISVLGLEVEVEVEIDVEVIWNVDTIVL